MPAAVVTGSSSGIGLATAAALIQRGYSVVLHGNRNLDGLESAASQLQTQLAVGSQLHCVVADISCQQACQRLVQACFHWHPRLDLWVNNAGADVLTSSLKNANFEEKLNQLWQVDVLGTTRLSRLVAARMLNSQQSVDRGRVNRSAGSISDSSLHSNSGAKDICVQYSPSIINIGWDQAMLGMEGEPGQLFCTAKSAVLAFTSALSLTIAPHVRVNAVSPGWIRTAWGAQSASPEWSRRAIAECQLERWGRPEDVAETICWLASPSANFITGQNIAVNGGRRFHQQA